jgi:hypothetical protein
MADATIPDSFHETQDAAGAPVAIDDLFQRSTMAVQSAVNREGTGSTPVAGAKSVRAERVKDWRRRMKDKIIRAMGGCCQICRYAKCAEALELHHLDPTKKEMSFGKLRANPRAVALIVPELMKCVLLCANCHREVHVRMTQIPDDHHRMSADDIAGLLTKHIRAQGIHLKGHDCWQRADFITKSISEIMVEFDIASSTADRWKRRQRAAGMPVAVIL